MVYDFKQGDLIECVDNSYAKHGLKIGELYRVIQPDYLDGCLLTERGLWGAWRFKHHERPCQGRDGGISAHVIVNPAEPGTWVHA